jgi:hypothetical protein
MTTTFLASIGVDISKEVFHVVGFGTDGKISFRRKIKRLALVETFSRLPPCVVGMEACLSAHFVSRALRQLGHQKDHPCDLCEAVREWTEERLQRRRSYCGGRAAAKLARRAGEDTGAARPAVPAPCSLPPGLAPNCDDQSDPCLPDLFAVSTPETN